ncbi:unnamed protein product [Boreogadus saida]
MPHLRVRGLRRRSYTARATVFLDTLVRGDGAFLHARDRCVALPEPLAAAPCEGLGNPCECAPPHLAAELQDPMPRVVVFIPNPASAVITGRLDEVPGCCRRQSELVGLARQCGLSQRQIQTWFRHRRNQQRPSNSRKFCEASWRFVFYLVAFTAGLASLIDTKWFWDTRECWNGYPKQPVPEAHYWYYIMELGFYLSLLLCVSVDVKRKDFKEQIVHHIATIFLIGFSYCANFLRVGTLVMLLHDSSDFFLESAKMFNYAGWRKTCDILFVLFSVVFLVTRLVIFPGRMIYSTMVESLDYFDPFPGYFFLNALLLVLQALHVFWAYLILRMVHKFVFQGKVEKDERSDEESGDDDEEEDDDDEEEEWPEEGEDEGCWGRSEGKGAMNSKSASLADHCVLNNLTHRRSSNSRWPKAR